ncbi:MAG: type I-E CRISPR-associated protein Cas6/Cse3/CasE [Chitinophagales bacterium]
MYLSLLCLNPASAAVQRDLRDVAELHRTVLSAFPNLNAAEVGARNSLGVLHRLEFERSTGRILLYVQSLTVPDWSGLPDGYLLQEAEIPNPAVKSVAEAYDCLKSGQVLRFKLRANPTRKIDTKSGPDGTRRNGRRVPVSGTAAQVEWLARKAADHGFEILNVSVAASGSAELARSHRRGCTFQGVVFEGSLAVRDPERFRDVLAKGLGSGKAFGFGLLSVAPPA